MNRVKMEELMRLWADGMEPEEICKHLKMNAKKVYLAIAIVELNNAGYTDSAIAKKLGVHQSTITRKRIDLGLSPIVRGRPRKREEITPVNARLAGYVQWARSGYMQHSDGLLEYILSDETDLPKRVRVVNNTERISRPKLY